MNYKLYGGRGGNPWEGGAKRMYAPSMRQQIIATLMRDTQLARHASRDTQLAWHV